MPEEQTNQTKEISLNDLKEKVKNGNFTLDDLQNYYKQEREKTKEFLSLLEWASQLKKDEKDFQRLLRKLSLDSVSDLMEDLKSLGYGIQKDLGENFEKSGYRLLEQVRAGKKSDVMYGITRIFITNQKNIPDALIEAFKPYYDDETFKCLLYAFLGAVVKPKNNREEE